MDKFRWFLTPSSQIKEPQLRARAELLLGLLIFRQLMVMFLFVVLSLYHLEKLPIAFPVVLLNLVAYTLARSRFFQWGALLIIIEPIILIPIVVRHPGGAVGFSDPVMIAPLWLSIGPVLSGLILPLRYTFLTIVATCLSFLVIFFEVPTAFMVVMSFQFLVVASTSLLSLIGSYLRDKVDRVLQLERSKVLQSSKLASLGEMAGGVAHELNSPLAAILLSVELLEEEIAESGGPNEPALEKIRGIGDIAERMAKIIDGLRTFSRDVGGGEHVKMPAQKWVTDSLDLCRQRFHNQGVKVELVKSGLETICVVQPIQLSQTLLNLLNNSFDAILDKPEKWIRIEARVSGSHFELLLTDSGQGISKEVANRLFEPFFTTKEIGHGTGLGLSISKGIMQKHGGDLLYEDSCPNTRFVMRLPLPMQSSKGEAA